MAITASERASILEVVVVMFDAAPGANILADIVAIYESSAGRSLSALASILGNTGAFQTLHPIFEDAQEFATEMLQPLGLAADGAANDWVVAQFNAGASKAAILYAAWDFLDDLPPTAAAQYQNAKAIMENKAQVSEYFSVILARNGGSLAVLQDVVNSVTADAASADAAIAALIEDAASGPVLTAGADVLNILGSAATTITGLADGDADGSASDGTFNAGDRITGNGNTRVEVTVLEGGAAGFVRLDNVESVDLTAATSGGVSFNAAAWTDVGSVRLAEGVDGLSVFLDHLHTGTAIAVLDVTGTISASYDANGGNLFARLRNNEEGGSGGEIAVEADGSVEVDMAAGMTAELTNTTGVELGPITVAGGDSNRFSAWFDTTDDMAFGNLDAEVGNDSVLRVGFGSVAGNASAGHIALEAGTASSALLAVQDVSGNALAGDIEVLVGSSSSAAVVFSDVGGSLQAGAITVTVGNGSLLDIDVEAQDVSFASGVTLGDVTLFAGITSTIEVHFAGQGAAGSAGDLSIGDVDAFAGSTAEVALRIEAFADVAVGDVDVDAGTSSSIAADIGGLTGSLLTGNVDLRAGGGSFVALDVADVAGDVTMGHVALEAAGDGASVAFAVQASPADVLVGDIATLANESSDVAILLQGAANLTVGNVTQSAGAGSSSSATLAVGGIGGDLSVGDFSVMLGDSSDGGITVANTAASVGTFAAGDVAAQAGNDSGVSVSLVHYATQPPTEDATGLAAGAMTVGDITLTVGSATDLDAAADGYATVLHGGKADDIAAGDLSVGDVSIQVGDGFVSGTLENDAQAGFAGLGIATASLGNIDIGAISLEGGDFAALEAAAGGLVFGADGTLGDGSIGNLSFTAGESAEVNFDGYWGALDAASVGGIEVGRIDVSVAQDAVVSIDVIHGVLSGSVGSVGDFSVAGLEATLGDNAQMRVGLETHAQHAGEEGEAEGDYFVGDIAIAVSATSTDDLSGGSLIDVDLVKGSTGLQGVAGGDFTVGDVALSGGDAASIDLDIRYTGTYDRVGDIAIGTIRLAAGDDAQNVSGTISVRNNAEGDFDTIALGGVAIELGQNSEADVSVQLLHGGMAGDFGDVGLGDIAFQIGDGSEAAVVLEMTMTADASVGDFSVGDVSLDLGDDSFADLAQLDVFADAIGSVTVGRFDATLDEGATLNSHMQMIAATQVGDAQAGDVVLDVGAGSTVMHQLIVTAGREVGAVTLGNWDLTLGVGAFLHESATILTDTGSIGAVTLGNIEATVTDGTDAELVVLASAGGNAGDMSAGDIDLSLVDAGLVTGTAETEVSGSLIVSLSVFGGTNAPKLTVGDIDLALAGTSDDDSIYVYLHADGDVALGDLTVSGEGIFSFNPADSFEANTTTVIVDSTGAKTIGNVDFSGFIGDANLDLSWTVGGAASITGGIGDDDILGNSGANVIAGGDGLDTIDISQGGNDTIVTGNGDSGRTAGTLDLVTGFTAGTVISNALSGGDRLDFNLVSGTAGNYVERAENFGTLAQFLSNANDSLNGSVRYFVQDNGTDTYIAVNYGSGEADVVIVLSGVADATTLQFQNFVA